MILPTKHVSTSRSLLGVAASVLRILRVPMTPTRAWEIARKTQAVGAYDRFVLALDLLYLMDAIEIRDGQLRRVVRS